MVIPEKDKKKQKPSKNMRGKERKIKEEKVIYANA
jgi:hypothetical protein